MTTFPSIFNDVIGPVMRGPSSSHCAASLRIGRICRDLMDGVITDARVEYDPNGSLATTHAGQGSDMGLFSGFLGWDADDERLPGYRQGLAEAGLTTTIDIHPIGATHPNTYKLTLRNARETRTLTAISTGGGMIEVLEIDGAAVSLAGDFFVTLVYVRSPGDLPGRIARAMPCDGIAVRQGTSTFIEVRASRFLPDDLVAALAAHDDVLAIRRIHPVLPVLSRKELAVPFITCAEMLDYNRGRDLRLWELAVAYESMRGGLAPDEVVERMRAIVRIMARAIAQGMEGTAYADRILGAQSLGLSEDEVVRAMLAAGLIGVFIAAHATFAAEVGGCMAECGSGSGMAAAALVELKQGTLAQSLAAASLALQSSLGLICDMIADRVEAPCLNRNVMAATTAISCANMALSDYDALIPLDEVIETMKRVGDAIPNTLRCTGLGGLAITPSAKRIEAALARGEGERTRPGFKVC
jgi:L-serine dehydratase